MRSFSPALAVMLLFVAGCQRELALRERAAAARESTFAIIIERAVLRPDGTTENVSVLGGSAFAIEPNRVVTCAHVLDPGNPEVVRVYVARDAQRGDKVELLPVKSAQFDAPNDLALLDVDALDAKPVTVRSTDIAQGDDVFWFGHPFDSPPTLRVGIVSAVPESEKSDQLTVDGAVNPGDSGGALFSRRDGALVGVVAAKQGVTARDRALREVSESIQLGIGYAIHARRLTSFLEQTRARTQSDAP